MTETKDADSGVQATLADACVEPGRKQTLTVRTERGVGVTYNSTYSDGESGRPQPVGAGYGGSGIGVAQKNGTMKQSWEITKEAPAGRVSLRVHALLPEQEKIELRLSFLVGSGDACP